MKIYSRKSIKALKIISLLFVIIFMNSCLSMKPKGTKSGKKLFETFFVGKQGTQYFIKPLIFENNKNNGKMHIDFTFRYKDKIQDSAVVNFSVIGDNIYKTIDKLKFSNNFANVETKKIKLLFNEKKKSSFVSRFSTLISVSDLYNLFKNNDWTITVENNNSHSIYKADKKSQKAITKLQEKVFVLM